MSEATPPPGDAPSIDDAVSTDGDERFSVDGARRAAAEGAIADWVHRFLASPGSDNAALASELDDRLGWWLGPVLVPMRLLHRLAGPAGQPVVCVIDDEDWRDDLDEMEDDVRAGWEPPPVIVSFRDGQLVVEDGNHRIEAVRRAGAREVWTIIGFAAAADRARYEQHPRSSA